jgi:hypothetical protein
MVVSIYYIVLKIMGSVPRRTEAILEGLDVNPGCFGQFSNIFNNDEVCFACNVILMQMNCINCHSCFLHYIMGSVPRWTKAIHGGPDVNQ